jgi:ribosomal protein L11 methyltransferase
VSDWLAIKITAEPQTQEAIEFLFNQLDSLGTEVQEFHLKPGEPIVVIGYFQELPDERLFLEQLEYSLGVYGHSRDAVKSIDHEAIQQTDWLREWKKHWRPTRVGRFLIAPEWEDVGGVSDSVVIRIDPAMAFGTGTHETTQLCLKAIDENFQTGMSFLDVGTGTGILAIAAAKLANEALSEIVAIDNDAEAVEIARGNAARNGIGERIDFRTSSLESDFPSFDFVCANLTLDVIVPMLKMLLDKSRRILVLSGILTEQETQIVDELDKLGINNAKIERDGEWISVLVRR